MHYLFDNIWFNKNNSINIVLYYMEDIPELIHQYSSLEYSGAFNRSGRLRNCVRARKTIHFSWWFPECCEDFHKNVLSR